METKAINDYVRKYDKIVIYIICYTLAFFIFTKTLGYTLPFVLAFLVSSILAKFIKWFIIRTKLHSNLIILVSLLAFYGTLGTLLTLLIINIVNQMAVFGISIVTYFTDNSEGIMNWFNAQYAWIISRLENLDPVLVETGNEILNNSLAYGQNVALALGTAIGKFSVSFISSIPYLFLVIIFTVICTYFFTKTMVTNPDFLMKYLPISPMQETRFHEIFTEGKDMLVKYGLSYLFIIMITGAISTIGYFILGVPYALLLGAVTAFLDLLPILGVSAAYVPIAIYYLSQGNTAVPLGLAVLWGVVAVGRNIWEPRIVASTLDMSPVITIIAIFIGLKLNGVAGMLFFMFMAVGFKVLQKVKVLESFDKEGAKI
ncbi:MAG TPA: sporulation integral membrane protein YtvI [Clostridiaceae bacterium]|nr:sporulation integral membrane protein YtvI [Clostridiaceae bacterium]